MGKRTKNSTGFWHLVDSLEGDKVIWMILLFLVMISILAISSSTPLLAIQTGSTRNKIIGEQLLIVGIGMGAIILLYNIKSIGFFRIASQLGFAVSFGMLIFLMAKLKLGPIKAVTINGATRAISLFGFQLHVFEFVKVLMVMYLAWAVNAYKQDKFKLANHFSKYEKLGFLARKGWKLFIYIYFPIIATCILLLNGSGSSAIFIGGIMFLTIIFGGVELKSVAPYILVAIIGFVVCIGLYNVSGKKLFTRVGTMAGRLARGSADPEEELLRLPRESIEFQQALDLARQPISAKIAIKEGGPFGKGVGKSTQKYIVPIMFEDYMFSFIVEEYGLWGALLILVLYCCLLARGAIIVKSCDNIFAKTAVAGLVLLISGQAFMHIVINCDVGVLTGQTLPMISHGNSSFLAFSAAFGIILSISRMAKKRIDKMSDEAAPIVEEVKDDVRDGLNDLDQLDNI